MHKRLWCDHVIRYCYTNICAQAPLQVIWWPKDFLKLDCLVSCMQKWKLHQGAGDKSPPGVFSFADRGETVQILPASYLRKWLLVGNCHISVYARKLNPVENREQLYSVQGRLYTSLILWGGSFQNSFYLKSLDIFLRLNVCLETADSELEAYLVTLNHHYKPLK